MMRVIGFLKTLKRDTSGATAIEYGLIATFIGLAIIASVQAVGENLLANFYDEMVAAFN